MADDPTTTTPNMIDQTELIKKTSDAFNGYSDAVEKAHSVIDTLKNQIVSLSGSIKDNYTLTNGQVQALNLVANAALGAREAFQGLNNIDTGGLNTFTGQIKQLEDLLKNSPAYKAAEENLIRVKEAAKDMVGGIGGPAAKAAIQMAENALKAVTRVVSDETKALAQNADNAVRLRDIYTGLAGSTGYMDQVNRNAGVGLQNLNRMMALQQQSITDTKIATGLSIQEVERYYTQMGTLPGAFDASTASLGGMTGGVNLLTSTIRIAKGAGMDYGTVIEGMRKAIVGYGASIPEALVFTTRIGEVANKFKINLSDVKQEILNTSDAFRMFGKDTSSAAQIMNQYISGLQQTGLSGQASANIVGNMTRQISQLSIAQKAFISAQSGGPGGLQGAFGIDMMLRQEGGQKKVMDMVMKTMQRQMGPLVSTAEAAQGGPAAAQFTKQIMMLQQGPLGNLAKSLPEAEHLVDALKLMSEGKATPTELKTDQQLIQQTMETGNEYQKQTATGISQIVSLMEQSRGFASGASLSLIQSGFTAGTGERFNDLDHVQNMRGDLQNNMNIAGKRDPLLALATSGQFLKDRKGEQGYQNIQDWSTFIKQAPDMIKEGKLGEAEQTKDQIMASIARKKEELANAPPTVRAAQTAQLENSAALAQAAFNNMKNTAAQKQEPEKPAPTITFNPKADLSDLGIPGENVRNAAARTAARTQAAPTATPNANLAALAPGAPENLGTINVDVTTYCSECHEKLAGQRHSHSVNVGQKKRK